MIYNLISQRFYGDNKLVFDKEKTMNFIFDYLVKNKMRVVRYDEFPSFVGEGQIDSYEVQIANVVKLLFDLEEENKNRIVIIPYSNEKYIEVIGLDNKKYNCQFVQERISFLDIRSRFAVPKDNVEEALDVLSDNQKPQITFICPLCVREDGENIFYVARL